MIKFKKTQIAAVLLTCGLFGWTCKPASADVRIEGQVQAGGGPILYDFTPGALRQPPDAGRAFRK